MSNTASSAAGIAQYQSSTSGGQSMEPEGKMGEERHPENKAAIAVS
jgi:hypothetical protein